MKQIKAIIRPDKVAPVLEKLSAAGFPAVTKIEVGGRGSQRGVMVGGMHYDELPKELLMIVVKDKEVEAVTDIIMEVAKTGKSGKYGDGKIFVSEVETAYTIRNGSEGL